MNWIEELFRQYEPLRHSVEGHDYIFYMNAFFGSIMALAFMVLGSICISMAGNSYPPTKTRKKSIIYFGWFLVFCGVVRGLDVTAYWHNMALLRGIFKIIASASFIRIISLAPKVIRETLEYKSLQEVNEQLKKTSDKLEEVKVLATEVKQDKK